MSETGKNQTLKNETLKKTDEQLVSLSQNGDGKATEELLKRFGYQGKYPLDIAAAKIVADISAAVHSASFEKMNEEERKQLLLSIIQDNIK